MAILTWRKKISNNQRFYMPSGAGIRLKYMLNVDDKGCECLVCSGQTDQYAEIQSYRDGCDLAMLLRNIDPNSLNNMISSYTADDLINSGIIDYASMPKTLGSMFNLVQRGENLFSGLPEEIRREFNYSVKNFVSQFGTQSFNDIISKYVSPKVDPDSNIDKQPEVSIVSRETNKEKTNKEKGDDK